MLEIASSELGIRGDGGASQPRSEWRPLAGAPFGIPGRNDRFVSPKAAEDPTGIPWPRL
jgi:hypothetical protein